MGKVHDRGDISPMRVSIGTASRTWTALFHRGVNKRGTTHNTAFAAPDEIQTQVDPASETSADREFGSLRGNFTTGIGVIETAGESFLTLLFYGSDADGETFDARLIGWRFVNNFGMWIPRQLCSLACTLGNRALPTNTPDLDPAVSYLWVDTITVTNDTVLNGVQKLEPGTPDNTPTEITIDTMGFQYITCEFTRNGKTAASMNALWATF